MLTSVDFGSLALKTVLAMCAPKTPICSSLSAVSCPVYKCVTSPGCSRCRSDEQTQSKDLFIFFKKTTLPVLLEHLGHDVHKWGSQMAFLVLSANQELLKPCPCGSLSCCISSLVPPSTGEPFGPSPLYPLCQLTPWKGSLPISGSDSSLLESFTCLLWFSW